MIQRMGVDNVMPDHWMRRKGNSQTVGRRLNTKTLPFVEYRNSSFGKFEAFDHCQQVGRCGSLFRGIRTLPDFSKNRKQLLTPWYVMTVTS